MKHYTRFFVIMITIFITGCFSFVFSQANLTMEEYNHQLQTYMNREAAALSNLAQISTEVDSMQKLMKQTESEIESTWASIYELVDAKEAEINEFRKKLEELEKEVDVLSAKINGDLSKDQKKMNHEIATCWRNKISTLTEIREHLSTVEKKMVRFNLKMMDQSDK